MRACHVHLKSPAYIWGVNCCVTAWWHFMEGVSWCKIQEFQAQKAMSSKFSRTDEVIPGSPVMATSCHMIRTANLKTQVCPIGGDKTGKTQVCVTNQHLLRKCFILNVWCCHEKKMKTAVTGYPTFKRHFPWCVRSHGFSYGLVKGGHVSLKTACGNTGQKGAI